MSTSHEHSHCQCGCCASIDRRDFMTTVGLSALAMQSGMTALASSAVADQAAAGAKPRVRAVFLRPKADKYWMGWPGASYDISARQADYMRTMAEAARQLGVELEVQAEPVADIAAVEALLGQCKKSPPDGVILTVMGLSPDFWPHANRFVAERGDIPTIVFSPMGTSFTGHLQGTRKAAKCFVAATQDYNWLATGMRILWTIWQMKNTRLCIINGDKTFDEKLAVLGTTLHHIPLVRWTEELAKLGTTAEVKALAADFSKTAKKVVEPKPEDVINAAKTYFVAKRIMAAEKCQGISLNCLGLIGSRRIPCPPCMAWSRLNDEASLGICECDWNAGIGLRLCSLLNARPGFQQDPAPEHGQRHADGRALHFGHQAPRFRSARPADDPAKPQRVGPGSFAADTLAGRRADHHRDVPGPAAAPGVHGALGGEHRHASLRRLPDLDRDSIGRCGRSPRLQGLPPDH